MALTAYGNNKTKPNAGMQRGRRERLRTRKGEGTKLSSIIFGAGIY